MRKIRTIMRAPCDLDASVWVGSQPEREPEVLVTTPKKCSTAIKYIVEELCEVLSRPGLSETPNRAARWSGRRLRVLCAAVLWANRGEQLRAILGARGLVAGSERPVSPMCHISTPLIHPRSKLPYCDLRL